jgi:hypothetical protein
MGNLLSCHLYSFMHYLLGLLPSQLSLTDYVTPTATASTAIALITHHQHQINKPSNLSPRTVYNMPTNFGIPICINLESVPSLLSS